MVVVDRTKRAAHAEMTARPVVLLLALTVSVGRSSTAAAGTTDEDVVRWRRPQRYAQDVAVVHAGAGNGGAADRLHDERLQDNEIVDDYNVNPSKPILPQLQLPAAHVQFSDYAAAYS